VEQRIYKVKETLHEVKSLHLQKTYPLSKTFHVKVLKIRPATEYVQLKSDLDVKKTIKDGLSVFLNHVA